MTTPKIYPDPEGFPKAYVASEHEDSLYSAWLETGAFSPHADKTKPAFSLVMPPPNANGNLHMGHALMIPLEDLMIRYHRMKGDRTLWIPGSDHAGIETQVVFEKQLEKEGRSRFQMTREQFYEEAFAFTLANKKNMEDQVRKLGASCDWAAERFTLDPAVVKEVYATFRAMYEDGLIYRGERIVNFSVKYQTAYSDIEVVHEDRVDPLYYMKYGPLVVATVRPETMFGDVAVAVHPDDPRYVQYVGTHIEITMATGERKLIPVIADTFVNPEFGTGAVKVTPAHDPNDFEMAQRHNLPLISVITQQGKLTEVAGRFAGLKVAEARRQVAETLQEMGLIEKIDQGYVHSVGLCYKSMQPLEPLVMPQWYVKVDSLKERAIAAIEAGEIEYYPSSYKKIQLDWLRNLRDWNISRQIWWGIPIKEAMPDNPEIAADEDTFDTWFSSAQWPFVTMQAMGDPSRDYLAEFYPNSVMETGRDILFSWVTRMIMLGLYRHGAVPFKKVYLHGMVLDGKGKKMSKSKGNVVSPMDFIPKYGADAVRFGLIVGTSAGSDIPLPEEKIIGGRNFANKVWNIARFIVMQLDGRLPSQLPPAVAVTEADVNILKLRNQLIKDTTEHVEQFRFAQMAGGLHEFMWHQFADVYLEAAKTQLDEQGRVNDETMAILYSTLMTVLSLLHPVMPFVTEAVYGRLPESTGMLLTQTWPRQ
jgi:valyl-tRNA synthetase